MGWGVVVFYAYAILSDLISKVFGVSVSEMIPISIYLAGVIVDMLLRGNKPYKFDSQFWQGKRFAKAGVRHQVNTLEDLKPLRIKAQKAGKKLVSAIENEFDVLAFVEFDISEAPIGAVLLQKGESLQLVFFWEVETFPSSISSQTGLQYARQIREALRSIPLHEVITFYSGAWRDYGDRIDQLKDPAVNRDKISHIINDWDASRIQTQTALGRRLSKTLTVSATFTTLSGRSEKANDGVEAIFDILSSVVGDVSRLLAPAKKSSYKNVPSFVRNGYERGWRSLNRLVTKQMGVIAKPLSFDQVWEREYSRYNSGDVPTCPFKIRVTPRAVKIERFSDLHLKSVLFRRGAPQMDKKHQVKLVGRGEKGLYVGGAVWEEKPLVRYEEDSGDDALAQLFFGSAVINDSAGPGKSNSSGSEVWDTEIVCQFTGISQADIRKRAGKLEAESNFSRKQASDKGEVSTTANFKLTKTGGDRWALLEGAQVVKIGWMAFVYRDNPIELERAVDALCDLPVCKGYVVPDRQYFPALWRQSLPIHHGGIGKGPVWWWNRQMEDFTEAAASFVPIVSDFTRCTTGLEFQSEYGNTPFRVEPSPADEANGAITLAESGGGKSVLLTGRICLNFTRSVRSFIIDATQGDVATFKPVCDALGGGYFNSREHCFNFMQGADLRLHEDDPEKYEYAFQLLQDQWIQTIPDLAIGGRRSPEMRADFSDLTSMLIAAWMRDPAIRQQYDTAFDGGFGSGAWSTMPTLRTFLNWVSIAHCPTESQTQDNERILRDFKSKLGAFLTRPSGERISQITTFDTDRPIVVCALGNINGMSETDVLPLISSVLGLTTASALTYPQTAIECDEFSKLSEYDCCSTTMGGYFSGGRKQGIYPALYGQDLASLQRGKDSSKYLGNCKTLQIGRVTVDAANYLADPEKGLGIPRNLLSLVDQDSTQPPRSESYSRWLIRTENKMLVGRYSPSFFQQAISFNGPNVDAIRDPHLAAHPNDRLAGYVSFARYLKAQSLDSKAKIEQFRR